MNLNDITELSDSPEDDEENILELTDEITDQEDEEDTSFRPVALPDEIRTITQIFETDTMPLMYLDKALSIIHITPQLRDMFKYHYPIFQSSFVSTFYKIFEPEQLKQFYRTVNSNTRGNIWSGNLEHKCSTAKKLITKTTVIPVYSQKAAEKTGDMVLFEDITEENSDFFKSAFTGILQAAKLKDMDTGKHNERLNYYSRCIARALYADRHPEVDIDFIENIGFLAAMHDVGKIGTPDSILQKQGPLDDYEWSIMREHTINGAFILSIYPVPMAKEIALSHHERWDGTGYPYRLEGEMIPLSARIVAIADVYDALRMKRNYKKEYNHQQAAQIILDGSGTHFDPYLVRMFEKNSKEFGYIWNILQHVPPRQARETPHSDDQSADDQPSEE